MHLVSAAILGIIQGLTEFLFFWKDWMHLAAETIKGFLEKKPLGNPTRKLAWFLIIATIPAAVAGLLFEDSIDRYFRSPNLVTVFTLIFFGLLLFVADRASRRNRTIDSFNLGDSVLIGISQAVALIPGVSRSGITMTTAMLRNSDRTSAARFSFLLSTPVIVGAGILETVRLVRDMQGTAVNASTVEWPILLVGIVFSSITGFLCIRYFLKYLQTHSFTPFVVYRIVLALVILIYNFK
ncbi:MAG: undecaprenyl-diphosphate phosphatase [Acidobacteriota bacterium]